MRSYILALALAFTLAGCGQPKDTNPAVIPKETSPANPANPEGETTPTPPPSPAPVTPSEPDEAGADPAAALAQTLAAAKNVYMYAESETDVNLFWRVTITPTVCEGNAGGGAEIGQIAFWKKGPKTIVSSSEVFIELLAGGGLGRKIYDRAGGRKIVFTSPSIFDQYCNFDRVLAFASAQKYGVAEEGEEDSLGGTAEEKIEKVFFYESEDNKDGSVTIALPVNTGELNEYGFLGSILLTRNGESTKYIFNSLSRYESLRPTDPTVSWEEVTKGLAITAQ